MAEPMVVGILDDMAAGPPGMVRIEWLEYAIGELAAAGRLDREVRFVHAYGLGLPAGSAAAVEGAFAALVDQGALLIVGPAIGDNALIATPLAERHRVPMLNWAGAERARGDYMFHLQVGSHEDESILLARHLDGRGVRRVGVIHDASPIGWRHADFFRDEAARLGMPVVATVPIRPLADDAGDQVAALIDARIDAALYLGLGLAAPVVASGLTTHGWSGPSFMNTAGIRGCDPAFARAIDGWTYVDMYSADNRTLAALLERSGTPGDQAFFAAVGYDLGRLVAEGLARAPELTRAGVREGLERIKWLPAAEGMEGTLLGFGVADRGALHGRYLVLRRWQDGQSFQVSA